MALTSSEWINIPELKKNDDDETYIITMYNFAISFES